jgi:hypothetical protein
LPSTRSAKFRLASSPPPLVFFGVVVSILQLAQHFKLSEDTVKHHLSNIFDKLGVSTRLELAQFAVNHKLPFKDIS